jgi:hypothetical protein
MPEEEILDWCDQAAYPPNPHGTPADAQNYDLWLDRMKYMCARNWQPWIIGGMLKGVLEQHFQCESIENPSLNKLVWRPTVGTGILIVNDYNWTPELANKRPAIVIKRNASRFTRVGLGDKQGSEGFGSVTHHTALWVGSHTVFCIGAIPLAADILGCEVQRELTEFSPAMMQPDVLNLTSAAALELGEAIELEEYQEAYAVPVTFGWAYQQNWRMEREAPVLRRVKMSTILQV